MDNSTQQSRADNGRAISNVYACLDETKREIRLLNSQLEKLRKGKPQRLIRFPKDSGSSIIGKVAAVPRSKFQAVIVDDDANLIEAPASKRLGIALNDAVTGDRVAIQTFGLIISTEWSWQEQQPILLGINGELIQGLPANGFILVLGFPEETNSFFLDAQTPLLRN